ncbi:BMP family ABC transporter substrate-binding protein [Azospirillum sp. SYSU D00513]|uniref:BMP family ABC transporter substrate-binding protein n=1 Tax=Azospirillum sp. SYSU D00513 TaxID=2812561 RepID=UPI001A97B199|nr:BMP family ABC transporter substrate-binding protein [Azospirillum sp. SYSU D00513]
MAEMDFNRRRILQGFGAAALATAAHAALAPEVLAQAPMAASTGAPLAVGVAYCGSRTDFGYNQAHADAAQALSTIPGVRLEEIEAEPAGLPAAVEDLVRGRGCRVVFVTAPGDLLSSLLAHADAHREAAFLLCAAPMEGMRLPDNVGFYDGFLSEAQHVSGIVAGYASASKTIGLVASHPSSSVLRGVNAFALGAKRADPAVTVQLAYAGQDATPKEVAAAAHALVNRGADVLVPHVLRPRPVLETAAAWNLLCCGVHSDLSAIAPDNFLTGAEWNWTNAYMDVVRRIAAGQPWPRVIRGGFKEGYVRNTPYGPSVMLEARAHADAARMQLANGNAAVFRGPVLDNTGRTVVPKGKALTMPDPALEHMVWLAEGVVELH